jgi:hypothetical protein
MDQATNAPSASATSGGSVSESTNGERFGDRARVRTGSTTDGHSIPEPLFLTALTTEHFGLQSMASTTVSEASSRASLYIFSLSTSLVAIGFSAGADALVPLVATMLPVVVVLGVFTIVRLVDTGVQNVQVLASIARIRAYYRTLSPDGATFFPPMGDDASGAGLAVMGLQRRRLLALFTMASMVSAIDSVVAGVGVALWVDLAASRSLGIGAGVVVSSVWTALFFTYQGRRYRQLDEQTASAANRASAGVGPAISVER